MKIIFVIGTLNIGGAENSMIRLANAMSKEFEVLLIYSNAKNNLNSVIHENVQQIQLRSKRMRYAFFEMSNLFSKISPDWIISTQTHVNLTVILASKLCGLSLKRIIVREVCSPVVFLKNQRLTTKLSQAWYPKVHKVVCVGKDLALEIKSYFKLREESVQAIYNGFDISEIQAKASVDVEHPFLQSNNCAVSISRVVPGKGLEVIIEALALSNIKVYWIVIGPIMDNEYFYYLQNRIIELHLEEQIAFIGAKTNALSYLNKADIFLFSSESEGLPGAIVEAILLNKKCISTACNYGPKELLTNYANSILVPVGDSEKFALALEKLINDDIIMDANSGELYKYAMEECMKQYKQLMI